MRRSDEVGAGDLGRGQAAEQLQRQGHAGRGREHGMARGEDEAEQVVFDVGLVEGRFGAGGGGRRSRLEVAADQLQLPGVGLVAADEVDGTAFCHRHKPSAGIARHALGRPLLQPGDEGVLREILREAEIAAEKPGQTGDEARSLDSPHSGDRGVSRDLRTRFVLAHGAISAGRGARRIAGRPRENADYRLTRPRRPCAPRRRPPSPRRGSPGSASPIRRPPPASPPAAARSRR